MINIADNMGYNGKKPLDNRIAYSTLALMKAVTDANINEGCLAYCAETDKYYKFLSTNTVDTDTGKWREFSSGGSDYTAGDGIDISNDEISVDPMPLADIDDIMSELPTGNRVAVTGYVPLGTIIPVFRETAPKFFLICDGSTYNKADYPELAELLLGLTTHSQYEVSGDDTKFKVPDLRGEFLRGTGNNSHSDGGNGGAVGEHQKATQFPMHGSTPSTQATGYVPTMNTYLGYDSSDKPLASFAINYVDRNISRTNLATVKRASISASAMEVGSTSVASDCVTARPTNTSVLYCIAYKDIYSNPMNDYSTTEKVVGTWINGATLYQKTVDCGALPNNDVKNVSVGVSGITVVNISGIAIRAGQYDLPLPYTGVDASASPTDTSVREREIALHFAESLNQIVIRTYTDRSAWANTYVTIQYTKS